MKTTIIPSVTMVQVKVNTFPRNVKPNENMVRKVYFIEVEKENVNADYLCDYIWECGEKLINFEVVETSIDTVMTALEIKPNALSLINGLKAVLITPELRAEYIHRVRTYTGYGTQDLVLSKVLRKMRHEQLENNPMCHESFLDMYMFNPIVALTKYFKHHVVPAHIVRMRQWNIDIQEVIRIKQKDNTIHFDNAMMQLYK